MHEATLEISVGNVFQNIVQIGKVNYFFYWEDNQANLIQKQNIDLNITSIQKWPESVVGEF